MKYAFINTQTDLYPIKKMCVWLEVSRSGFYEWRDRPPSPSAVRRANMAAMVRAIFEEFDGRYGYRRIAHELTRRGRPASYTMVASIMTELGLIACQPRPYRATTIADTAPHDIPDLLKRDFTADEAGTKLVGDITYVKSRPGTCSGMGTVSGARCAGRSQGRRIGLVHRFVDQGRGNVAVWRSSRESLSGAHPERILTLTTQDAQVTDISRTRMRSTDREMRPAS